MREYQPSVRKPKGRDYWQTEYVIRGYRFVRNLTELHGAKTESEAKSAARVQYKLDGGVVKETTSARGFPTVFEAACDRYMSEKGCRAANVSVLATDIDRLLGRGAFPGFVGRDQVPLRLKRLNEINDALITEVIQWRRGHYRWGDPEKGHVSDSTVNRGTTEIFSRVLTHAVDVWKLQLPNMPTWSKLLLDEPKPQKRIIRPEEDAALTEGMYPDYEVVRQFALASGWRLKELLISWGQVDFDLNMIMNVRVKGGHLMDRPMSARMKEILLSRVGHDEKWVFTYAARRDHGNRRKGMRFPITIEGLKAEWHRVRARAGIPNSRKGGVKFHSHRHTFGTYMRRAGDLRATQAALGHANSQITETYTHVFDDELAGFMDAADQARRAMTDKARIRKAGAA